MLRRCKKIKILTFIWVTFCSVTLSFAQSLPKICGEPAVMTKTCREACLICDIDGFTGRNISNGPGERPPNFCTTTNHNITWIAFMAGSPTLTLELQVYNCVDGDGLEVGIYESLDCQKISLVSNCEGDVNENTATRLTFTKPIVEGQYYYLVIDGNMGDVCDYTVKVINGSTKVSPLDVSGEISGDQKVCAGTTTKYDVSFITGATWHFWELNGNTLGVGNTKDISWTIPGFYTLCAQAVNACDDAPPNCIDIEVYPKEKSAIQADICNGDFYVIGNSQYNTTGTYVKVLRSQYGCDSVVELDVRVHYDTITYTDLLMCQGDTLKINNKNYSNAGLYFDSLYTTFGCDSIIELNIQSIVCNIQAEITTQSVLCKNESNGKLIFSVTIGTPGFIYMYENLNNSSIKGVGQITQLYEQIVINNLPAGDYRIRITDFFGNQRFLYTQIEQPEKLISTFVESKFNAYSISCYGFYDGFIESLITGGTKPYSYFWNNGMTTPRIEGLSAGKYQLNIVDANGCPFFFETELNQPDSLTFQLEGKNPSCEDSKSGTLKIINPKGGIEPYSFSFNYDSYQTKKEFDHLSAGTYDIEILDKNGCKKLISTEIIDPEHNTIFLPEEYTIELGDSVEIILSKTSLPKIIEWTPAIWLSCTNCIQPIASSLFDTYYTIRTISKDGCLDSAKVLIRVIKDKRIWAPNIFSPNGDGINDHFKIYSTKQVKEVISLEIYGRWGERIYMGQHFNIHDEKFAWNGNFRDRPMNPGVFVYVAHVKFLDDTTENISGDFTLIR